MGESVILNGKIRTIPLAPGSVAPSCAAQGVAHPVEAARRRAETTNQPVRENPPGNQAVEGG